MKRSRRRQVPDVRESLRQSESALGPEFVGLSGSPAKLQNLMSHFAKGFVEQGGHSFDARNDVQDGNQHGMDNMTG